ncbi:hypothetical protein [Brachybacterium vulturis]|uniref:hypothetical protein n=1 Tax=Brachybacterium vulturis TaxID=2017484 RepID=UPI003734D624
MIDVLVRSEDVRRSMPDAEGFLRAAAAIGCGDPTRPTDCVRGTPGALEERL